MTENNPRRSRTTILIKAEGDNGAEEEIELDEETTNFLAQLVNRNANSNNDTNDGICQEISDEVGVQGALGGQVEQQQSSEPCDGSTYILNSDTGELELLQIGEMAPPVGRGAEVEVVTVDSNALPGGAGIQIQREEQNPSLVHYNAFLDQLKRNVGKSQMTRVGVPQTRMAKQTPSSGRMKSAPALLRSSRRAASATAGTSTSCEESSSSSEKISGEQQSQPSKTRSVKPSGTGTSSGQGQLFARSKGVASFVKPEVNEGSDLAAPVEELYFIYENADGEQVAQIIESPSHCNLLNSPTTNLNLLCQLENPVRPSDLGSLRGATGPKGPKSTKKKSVRKPRLSTSKKTTKTNGKKGGVAELKCMEKGCSNVAVNIIELRKHLTNEHDMLFDSEKVLFPSDAAFKEWREQYERERMVSFIYRGGTKKISKEQSVTYMICHRSGHYKPTMADESKRQRKMKPQGSCKIGGYCTASIKLLKNLVTGEVSMDICHTHYGHPLDSEAIPHLRVNPLLRKIILKKFEEGMTFPEMLAYIHHNPDRLEGLRMVDRRAVRNIYDTWRILHQKKVDDHDETKEDPLRTEEFSPEHTETQDLEESHNMRNDVEKKMFAELGEDDDDEMTGELQIEENSNHDEEFEGTTTMSFEENWEQVARSKIDAIEYSDDSQSQNSGSTKTKDNFSDDDDAPVLHPVGEQGQGTNEGELNDYDIDDSLPVLVAVDSVTPSKRKKCRKYMTCGKRKRLKKRKVENLKIASMTDEEVEEQDKGRLSEEEYIDSTAISSSHKLFIDNIRISAELEAAIHKLHNHGESGPTILLYKPQGDINVKYGDFCRTFREDDLCLIIQTPVQRQILQMFPKIIHFEILDKPKPSERDLKLCYLSVLDDYREAIPVAWIVADSMCPRILNQLCRTIRYHCGELPAQYIMAPKNIDILKSWTTHFRQKPKILQSEFSAKRDLRILLNRNIPNDKVRSNISAILDEMINTKSPDGLKGLKEKLAKLTKAYPNGSPYLRKMEKDWFSRIEEWSFAYRTSGTSCNLLFASDSFLKLKKFVSFKGTKQINYTVDHILKIGYDKCFLRTKRMFKGDQKFCGLLESLDKYHISAKDMLKDAVIASDCKSAAVERKWTITTKEGEEQVEVSELKSPCDCKIICKRCNICMHAYLCSCKDFTDKHVMCAHIHRIHCFQTGKVMEDEEETPTVEGSKEVHCPEPELVNIEGDGEVQEAMICEDGTEITFVSDNHLDGLNLTEVLQAASGLFGPQGGRILPKIVSITDADDDKIIYDGESGVPVIFQYDGDVDVGIICCRRFQKIFIVT